MRRSPLLAPQLLRPRQYHTHGVPLNPYRVLNVSPDATLEDIKGAYRKKAMKLHPDRPGGDAARMKELTEAYEILMKADGMDGNLRFWRHEAHKWQAAAASATGRHHKKKEDGSFWYSRQHMRYKKDQSDDADEDGYTFGIFGRWGQDRRWWEEITSEERHRHMREREVSGKRIDPKDPFGLKQSRIILGTGIADGSIRW